MGSWTTQGRAPTSPAFGARGDAAVADVAWLSYGTSSWILGHLPRLEDLPAPVQARIDNQLSPDGQADLLAARMLARHLAIRVMPGPSEPKIEQRCSECSGRSHGRPYFSNVDDWAVSWSHSHGLVAAVVSRWSIGVDIEPVGCRMGHAGRSSYLTWTRMEALVKVGAASLDDPWTWPSPRPTTPWGYPHAELHSAGGSVPGLVMYDIDAPQLSAVISVAMRTDTGKRVFCGNGRLIDIDLASGLLNPVPCLQST